MASSVLEDVVAYVAGDTLGRVALQARLKAHGARAVRALNNDVTHVVWCGGAGAAAARGGGAASGGSPAALLELFERLDAAGLAPAVVSLTWVEQSAAAGRRLVESRFAVARPKEAGAPAPAAAAEPAPAASRKRGAARPAAKDTDAGGGADDDGVAARGRPKRARGAAAGAAAAPPGRDTQAVADILALDLPGEAMVEKQGADRTLLAGRAGAVRPAARGRSRLAHGSGPRADEGEPAPAAGAAARPAPAAAAAARPFVPRVSTRALVAHPDRRVLVLKSATPFPGAMPRTSAKKKRPGGGAGIPVPFINRVESPWASQQPGGGSSQDPAATSQPEGAASQPATQDGASGGALTAARALNRGGELPSPWTQPRAWDCAPPRAKPAAAAAAGGTATEGDEENAPVGAATPAAAAVAGTLALTSVDAGLAELARSACRRLRGVRPAAEGREEAATHLVVGAERRTLKLLLAVASGAALVTPAWVTASLEAGRWLPDAPFAAGGRFAPAAARARAARGAPLLRGRRLHVAAGGGAAARRASPGGARDGSAAALRRVAAALGAAPAPPKAADVCVVAGGGGRPAGLPRGVPCVREEWLLQCAERYEEVPTAAYLLK